MISEKFVDYGGLISHVRTPKEPQGLCFVISGENMPSNDRLIQGLQKAAEDKGLVTVVPELLGTQRNTKDITNAHGDFSKALNAVIAGYYDDDNSYKPKNFEIIAHSIGASAALSQAPQHNLSQLTVLDPIPMPPEILADIECPVHMVLSEYKPFRRAGKRIFNAIEGNNSSNTLDLVATGDNKDAHNFRSNMADLRSLVHHHTLSSESLSKAEEGLTQTPEDP